MFAMPGATCLFSGVERQQPVKHEHIPDYDMPTAVGINNVRHRMKRITLLFLLVAVPCLGAYDKRLVHILDQLRECTFAFDEKLPMVGGAAVGEAASPHEFYLLLPYVLQIASADDLRAMIRDPSPVVRIMAATCILRKEDKDLAKALESLSKDQTKVFVAPYGCTVLKQSVAQIVADMKRHPRYFEGEEEPNQHLKATGRAN